MPNFYELTLGYQLELAKKQIFDVVKQLPHPPEKILFCVQSDCYQIF